MAPLSSEALVVADQVVWGYDNKVVPGYINPLSVRVFNDTPRLFNGKLELSHSWSGEGGTVLVEDCYVSPYTERWIQFYVYVAGARGGWKIKWGRGPDERVELPVPKAGPPARVFLTGSDVPGAGQTKLQRFPANLFPPAVLATKGLHSVVMDAAPSWEATRRRGFLDWLKRGGTLHLIQGADGRFPRFSDDLSELNTDRERFRVGGGRVVRHEKRRAALTANYLAGKKFPPPRLESGSSNWMHRFEDTLFAKLRARVKVKHKWWLIHLLVGIYVCLIGPVNAILANTWRKHFRAILFFLVAVAGAGLLLSAVGRRGYGESNTVKSVAVAQSLGDGTYDVSQWSILFATRSRRYDISHDAPHNVYSTGDSYHPTRGRIHNGRGGRLSVSVPLFSSVAFLYRGRLPGPAWSLKPSGEEGRGAFPSPLRIENVSGSGFPDDPIALWACHDGRYYTLERDGEYLRPRGRGEDLGAFFEGRASRGFATHDEWPSEEDMKLLMARALRHEGPLKMGIIDDSPDRDRVCVFVMAKAPETFHVQTPGFEQQDSHVLYQHDVILPGQS